MSVYIIMFDKAYNGLFGHVESIVTSEIAAKLHCVEQNNIAKSLGLDLESWYVTANLNTHFLEAHRLEHLVENSTPQL